MTVGETDGTIHVSEASKKTLQGYKVGAAGGLCASEHTPEEKARVFDNDLPTLRK